MKPDVQELLLKSIITENPHINIKLAEDWLENTIEVAKYNVSESIEESLSNAEMEDRIKKMVKWHIRRLSGFGGSDMSALIMEYNGDFYPFGNAEDVVREKICLTAPEPFVGDTERGTIMEPIIRRKFEKAMRENHDLVLHTDAYKKLNKFQESGAWDEHPWMKASPDGIYLDLKTGETWLVDFKCPAAQSTVLDNYEDPAIYYKAQLAQYKILLEEAGVRIDHTVLAPFSLKEMKIYIAEFPVTDELIQNVLDAGDYYWEFVLKNELPKRPPGKNFQYVKEVPAPLQELISEMIVVKKLESIAKSKGSAIKDRALELALLSGIDWKKIDTKTRIPGLDISHKEVCSVNNDLIHAEFRRLGGNPDDEKYHETRTQTSISVIRSQKSEHAPFIGEVQEIAIRMFEDALLDVKEYTGLDNKATLNVTDPTLPALSDGKPNKTKRIEEPDFEF